MSRSTLGKITKYFPLEISFELDCCIDGAKVYTTDSVPNQEGVSSESDSDNKGYLAIEVWTQLDAIDSWLDGNRHTRPVILTLLSIISYLLDHPLTVYQAPSNIAESAPDEKPDKVEVSRFIHNQIDKSSDLLKILEAVYRKGEDVNQFVISALSRWHKARYLEEESNAKLYDEESFLAYFHIMELSSNYYSVQQSNEAQNQIRIFIKELLANTLKLRDSHLEQVTQEKYKAVRSILLSDGEIPIISKICYFLDQVGLLDPKTQYFVEQLVKIRNSIAHGRYVYHKELNWPLPPFFPINLEAERYIFEIRVFTGRAIGAFLEIEAWSDTWANIHPWLHPPIEYVRKFISSNSFETITSTDFINGNVDGVRPSSLVEQFLSRKISFQALETGLRSLLLNVRADEDNAFEIFEAAIILADSSDKQLSEKCQNMVADIHKNKLVWYSNVKDILRELEFQGVKPVWFRKWIETGSHRV